jgi:hypothetical protein
MNDLKAFGILPNKALKLDAQVVSSYYKLIILSG